MVFLREPLNFFFQLVALVSRLLVLCVVCCNALLASARKSSWACKHSETCKRPNVHKTNYQLTQILNPSRRCCTFLWNSDRCSGLKDERPGSLSSGGVVRPDARHRGHHLIIVCAEAVETYSFVDELWANMEQPKMHLSGAISDYSFP